MKHPSLFLSILLATVICACQSAPKEPAVPTPMDMEAMMAKMMELATPGAEHQELMRDAGTWDSAYKMRMAPDAPWTEFRGSATCRPLLDGRYLWQDVEWSMPDPMSGQMMPMKAFQILGYGKMSNEYTALWADAWSTWMITSRGKRDARGVLNMSGTMRDAAGERPFRMEIREDGADQRHITMCDTIPPQGEVVVMEIAQKRRK
ncbi:MAG: DUF1579 domain-containing protein [Planctomycetes bacterium]|nr:DUF1579 domain-containing protein [Planctomycetota bacterium]